MNRTYLPSLIGAALLSALCATANADGAAKQNTPQPAPQSVPSASNAAATVEMPSPAPTQNRMTLVQAIQTGLRDNPQNTAARYSVQSAHANYDSQRAPINPTFQYGALNNTVAPADIGTGLGQAANYSVYVTLETNGAQHFRAVQSREAWHQAEFDAETSRLFLKLNIIDAYVSLQVANRQLEVEQTVYTNMGQLAQLTQKRFEIGAGTQADALRARVSYVQEEQNLISDVAAVSAARAQLNAQLGHPTDTPVDAVEPLAYGPVPLPDVGPLTALAEKNRTEVLSAAANLRSLKAAPGLARSQYFPNLILGKDLTPGNVNIGAALPIDLGGIAGEVRRAKADVKTQEAQLESARLAVDLDVKTSYINLAAAKKQVDSYETGILKQSETLFDELKQSYLLGANSILDVITAENTYRAVQSAYFTAVGGYRQALYTMEHSIGAPLNATPGATLLQTTNK
jgi:outer membrane protein TolC